jgi:putative ABC transport system permease protein
LVSPDVLRRLAGSDTQTLAIWARTAADVDSKAAAEALGTLATANRADLGGGMENRSYVNLQLNILVLVSLGLLAVALLIALIGIANTLGLSVLERTREHALLRAMGLTRGQLRGTLAVEAVLLATVTSVIGVLLGSAYAFVGVQAVLGGVLGETGVSLHVPIGQLLLVVLGAAVAGLAACVLPARTAARVVPAAGLSVA